MTSEQIDRLLRRRDKLTQRRDGRINRPALNEIDVQLREVPPGQDNRIDLYLGRPCAVLPKRVIMVQHISGVQEVAPEFGLSAAEIAHLQARCEETETEPPAYDGMWK